MLSTIPNILSLCRIALVPLVIIAFYVDNSCSRWAALIIFMIACFTDFLDGYLARIWQQTSRLGQALDPIADKLLVSSTLLLLAGFDRITRLSLIPTTVILCREIMVSGLREYLSEFKLSLPVSFMAKWKTAVQMFSIGCLLLGDASKFGFLMRITGEVFLWIAAAMTLITGWDYLKTCLHEIDSNQNK